MTLIRDSTDCLNQYIRFEEVEGRYSVALPDIKSDDDARAVIVDIIKSTITVFLLSREGFVCHKEKSRRSADQRENPTWKCWKCY